MLLSTHNLLKRKQLETQKHSQKLQKINASKSQPTITKPIEPIAPLPPPIPVQNNFCNGIFKNSAANQKDFVLLKIDDGFNEKVTHCSIAIKSILRSVEDQFEEIKKGTKCKVQLNDKKIHSAVVICKGSKDTISKCLDSFCSIFDAEELLREKEDKNSNSLVIFKPVINTFSIKEQLNIIMDDISKKQKEILNLRRSQFDLLELEKKTENRRIDVINQPVSSADSDNITNTKEQEDESLKSQDNKEIKKIAPLTNTIPKTEKTQKNTDEYHLIPSRIREEVTKLSKESDKKHSFLFRTVFVNCFKDRPGFFRENNMSNITKNKEYSQFVQQTFSFVKTLRPNVTKAHCNAMVAMLHYEAKRKTNSPSMRLSLNEKTQLKQKAAGLAEVINGRLNKTTSNDSDGSSRDGDGTRSGGDSSATSRSKKNLNGLTDEEKLNILDTKSSASEASAGVEPNIDYILIEDSNGEA